LLNDWLFDLRAWFAQALLSTTLALIVLADGAADAVACAAVDDVEDVPVEGEEAGAVVGAVWSPGLPDAGVAGPLLTALEADDWPAWPGW
jgi:hypothetical protein